jgi:hypothetical protein
LANTIINEAGSLTNKQFVLAEAKFMRAYCYFELTTMFCLRLTNPTELNAKTFGLAKVQELLFISK